MQSNVRVCADLAEMSRQAAEGAASILTEAARAAGRCSIVLSGGSTPRLFYRQLASDFRDRIPWDSLQVFWGDERYVPPEDPRSNYRMAKETLLDHIPCPPENIHPMPTHLAKADLAAHEYERTLRDHFAGDWPHFDLVLLGVGDDGHTASLFPGAPALAEGTRWVVAAEAPAEPRSRLTMTLPALTRAEAVYVLVTGAGKAKVLEHVLEDHADVTTYPAAGLRRGTGSVTWWADRDAAAALDGPA